MRSAALFASIALLALAPSALAAESRAEPDRFRYDFGPLDPGDVRNGTIHLRNHGDADVRARLVPDAATPYLRIDVEDVLVAAGAEVSVPFLYEVPLDAPPGEHGEALRILDAPTATGGATLSAGSAIVFTSRTRALGITAIEAPETLPPGTALTGRVLVVNTAAGVASARILVELVPQGGGAPVAAVTLDPRVIDADGTTAFPYDLGDATWPGGRYAVRARLVDVEPTDAKVGRAQFEKGLVVGERAARVTLVALRDLKDGNAELTVLVEGVGDMPVTLRPRVTLAREDGPPVDVTLDLVELSPGQSTTLTASIALPPGEYRGSVAADAQGARIESAGTGALLMGAAAAPLSERLGRLLPWVVGGLALAGAALAAPRAAPLLRASAGRLSLARRHVALLVDVGSVGHDPAQLARWVIEATVGRAAGSHRAYLLAPSRAAAVRAREAIAEAGLVAHVRTRGAGGDPLAQLLADALMLAQQGDRVVVVTRDASLADALGRLRRGIVLFPLPEAVEPERSPRHAKRSAPRRQKPATQSKAKRKASTKAKRNAPTRARRKAETKGGRGSRVGSKTRGESRAPGRSARGTSKARGRKRG